MPDNKKIVRIPPNKLIRAYNFQAKNVLVRVDYNVPIESSQVADDNRIQASLETLEYILRKNPKNLYIASHLGRPDGKFKKEFEMYPVAKSLHKLLGLKTKIQKISLGDNVVLRDAYKLSSNIFLLENLRFDKGEEDNGDKFAREIASIADVYVVDAFATLHRKHASTDAITDLLPTYAGLLVEREVNCLLKIMHIPERPYVFVIGGAKIEDKMPLIEAVRPKCDLVLAGGKVANQWQELGHEQGEKVKLPVDGVSPRGMIVPVNGSTLKEGIYDIGPQTILNFKGFLAGAKTIVWNGCLGKVEESKFAHGTCEIARFIAKQRAEKVILGGDTAAVIDEMNLAKSYTFVSTGGSASTEFMAGKRLPGLRKFLDEE